MKWIALLRGVNLGPHHRISPTELREAVEAVGGDDVRTYIQSGNAVFSSTARAKQALASRIAAAIDDAKGFRPDVMLLGAGELKKVIKGNPFPDAAKDPSRLHAWFLAGRPAAGARAKLDDLRAGDERYEIAGSMMYLSAPAGIGRSQLALKAERALGVPATARNWRTVEKLMAMAEA